MKKILLTIILLFAFLDAKVITKTTTRTATGEGVGISREVAINNAIIEAISKMNGVSISSIKQSNTMTISNKDGTDINDIYGEQIKKITKGKADTYEINSVEQDGNGKYIANVTISKTSTNKKYQTPGLNANSRRSISVFNASSDEFRGIGNAIQQKLITNLLNSRKFNVLDRDSNGYYALEKSIITSKDAASDEIYKLGNVLGSDYLLIFSVAGMSQNTKHSNISSKTSTKIEIAVDYRIILFATRQIKYSNTLTISMKMKEGGGISEAENKINDIALKISNDILNAIYPLKIANIEKNEVAFTQKLTIGDIYECFSLGKTIKDAYTKENTGNIETKSGEIEITRSTPKISYGKIIKGKINLNNICRPLSNSDSRSSEGRDANYNLNESGGVNLGF